MRIVKYLLTNIEDETFLIRKKAKYLVLFNLLSISLLLVLLVFVLTIGSYEKILPQLFAPGLIIMLLLIDVFLLKYWSYKIASSFLVISVTVAMSLQLILIQPDFLFGDFTSTFYFIFAAFSMVALFARRKLIPLIIFILTTSLILNIVLTYNKFPEADVEQLPMRIAYFFSSLCFTVSMMFMVSYLFNSAIKRLEHDKEQIADLAKYLRYQNRTLEKTVEKRTKEVVLQKDVIIARNNNLQQQNEEINTQKEEILIQRENLKLNFKTLEKQQDELHASIRYAETIQHAILPQKEDLDKAYNNFVIYKPKDIVSGDFYWYSQFKTGSFESSFVVVSDCSGHGVPGAFLSILGGNLLDDIINKEQVFNTADVLEIMNDKITKLLKQKQTRNHDGMDMGLLKLIRNSDANKIDLYFSGAKRPILIYSKEKKEVIQIRGNSRSIGGFYQSDVKFIQHKETVKVGDLIYMFTDGYTDQNSPSRKKIGIKRVKDLIEENAHKRICEQKKIFEDELTNHQGLEEQRDDVTLLCIQL